MSRQYSNRPYIPSRPHVSLQMCDFVSYPTAQPNDTSSDSSSWQLTDPLSCMHQQQQSTPSSTENNFSYFQYPPHRHTLESPLIAANRETTNNQHLNQSNPSCHFHYLESNESEPPRPLLPLSRVTVKEEKKNFFFYFLLSLSLIYSRLQQQQPLLLHIIDIIV